MFAKLKEDMFQLKNIPIEASEAYDEKSESFIIQ